MKFEKKVREERFLQFRVKAVSEYAIMQICKYDTQAGRRICKGKFLVRIRIKRGLINSTDPKEVYRLYCDSQKVRASSASVVVSKARQTGKSFVLGMTYGQTSSVVAYDSIGWFDLVYTLHIFDPKDDIRWHEVTDSKWLRTLTNSETLTWPMDLL